jgi:ADP-heptose:LPS heptosyltransferase
MRVLVCLLSGLGDAIMTSPMIRAIKMQRPDIHIEAISAIAPARDYAFANPDIDSAEHEDFLDYSAGKKLYKLLRLRMRRYDFTILPYPAPRWQYHAGALVLADGRLVTHNYRKLQRLFPGYHAQLPVEPKHQSKLNIALLPALGLEPVDVGRYTFPSRWGFEPARIREREIAFHLSSANSPISKGNERKSPPLSFFAAVIQKLASRGYKISAVGSGAELAAIPVLEKMTGVELRAVSGKLRDVAETLSKVSCVVAPDSGIGHLAAAVGTPVFSIFGVTDPRTFAPLGNVCVYRPSSCPACFKMSDARFACKRDLDFACLGADLNPEAATAALLRFVASQSDVAAEAVNFV